MEKIDGGRMQANGFLNNFSGVEPINKGILPKISFTKLQSDISQQHSLNESK